LPQHQPPATHAPHTLSLHDALPISHRTDRILPRPRKRMSRREGTRTAKTPARTNPSSRKKEASRRIDHVSPATWSRKSLTRDPRDRKSTRLNSSHVAISYAVFCLKK